MQNIENELCAERDNLKYDMRFEYIPDGEKRLREINKKIRTINHIEKKIALGIKSGYGFIEDDIKSAIFMDDHLFGLRLKKEYFDRINTTFVNYYLKFGVTGL